MNNLPALNQVYQFVCGSSLSDFYRSLYGANRPASIASSDVWMSLPLVTKDLLRKHPFLSRIYLPYETVAALKITSGTSGNEPLIFPRIRPPRYENHFDATRPTSCILNFFPPQHLMQLGRDAAEVSNLTVIDGDAANLSESVQFAIRAGLDHILCTPSLIDVLTPVLQQHDATAHIKRIELGGERITPAMFRRLRENFPNAFLWADYGMTETQGVAGVGEITDAGAHYTPTPGYYWEIVDAHGAIIHDAGVIGELLISHTEYEDVAFPLLRYRTGDYARLIKNAESDEMHYEILGRVDLDYIKIAGGELRIEVIESAVRDLHPLLSEDFEVHAFSRDVGRLPSVEIHIATKNDLVVTEALSKELAHLLAGRIRVSPTRTYAQGVADGLYASLCCKVVPPFPKSRWKRRRMFQHE